MFKRLIIGTNFLFKVKIFILGLLFLNLKECNFEITEHKSREELKIMIRKEEEEYQNLLESEKSTNEFFTMKKKVSEIQLVDLLNVENGKQILGIDDNNITTIQDLVQYIKTVNETTNDILGNLLEENISEEFISNLVNDIDKGVIQFGSSKVEELNDLFNDGSTLFAQFIPGNIFFSDKSDIKEIIELDNAPISTFLIYEGTLDYIAKIFEKFAK